MNSGIITHVTSESVYMFTPFRNKHIILKLSRKDLSKEVSNNIKVGDEVSYEETANSSLNKLDITNVVITQPGIHETYISTVLAKLKIIKPLIYMPISGVLKLCLENSKELEPTKIIEEGLPNLGLKPIGIAYLLLGKEKAMYEPLIIFEEV